jgi:hypothetical protein
VKSKLNKLRDQKKDQKDCFFFDQLFFHGPCLTNSSKSSDDFGKPATKKMRCFRLMNLGLGGLLKVTEHAETNGSSSLKIHDIFGQDDGLFGAGIASCDTTVGDPRQRLAAHLHTKIQTT